MPFMSKRLASFAKRMASPLAQRFVGAERELPASVWDLERDTRGALTLHGQSLASLAERFGSPLFVFDGEALDRNAAAFMEFSRTGDGPQLDCFFSYKTTPVSGVLSRLHARGVGAEVISEYELWLARRLGVPGDRILANGPGRTPAALRSAIELGALVYVNHAEEIPLVAELARAVGRRARVGVRVVVPGGWSGQFGEPIADGSALRAFRALTQHPELDVEALHFHRGEEISEPDAVTQLVCDVFSFAAELRRELGIVLRIVDLGGSLGCPSASKLDARDLRWRPRLGLNFAAPELATRLSIREYVGLIRETVRSECVRRGLTEPRIYLEPGRALTGNAALLLCRVTGLKASGAPGFEHAILDAGVNVAEPMRSEFHQILHVQSPRSELRRYRLVGPICTPMDTLRWSYTAGRLAPGDALAIMDTGAYFLPFATSFSFPQPGIVMVDRDGATEVRRPETFEHMAARDLPADAGPHG
jgi:diaminopimelate decarboxylase